jgi:SulP family sulfate permease
MKHGYPLDADRELVGLGAANLTSAAFGGLLVAGSFSRSAVNDQAGARTPVANAVAAATVAIALLVLTPGFVFLPTTVLAGIILVAVYGLIDLAEVKHLWRTDRVDLGLLAVTFVATLALGIEQGILAGVGTSMVVSVARRSRPPTALDVRLDPGSAVSAAAGAPAACATGSTDSSPAALQSPPCAPDCAAARPRSAHAPARSP